MKSKRVLSLLAVLAVVGPLAGCNFDKESTTSNETTSSNTSVPVSENTSESVPESTTTPVDEFDNLKEDLSNETTPRPEADNPVSEELPEGALTREYDAANDSMVNDFSTALDSSKLTGTYAKVDKPYLQVRVNSSNEVYPNSDDASIYKMATGTYALQEGYAIGFRMKLNGEKKIGNDHLVLALRGDDALQTFPISLSKALDPDGEHLPELTGEYQDFVIDPQMTISNENTPYKNKDGSYSNTKVLDIILGFHLYADGIADATLDIEQVFLRKSGSDDIVIDNFEHEKPNNSDPNLYWRDSTGTIIQREVTLKDATYTETLQEGKENLVLNVKGDVTNTSLKFSDGENEVTKTWSELKTKDGQAVVSPLAKTFSPLVINIEQSGVAFAPTSVSISSKSELTINKIYLSDLISKAAEEYPAIDYDTKKVFDDFNRTQNNINGDYDASHADPVVIGAGLDYVLSYNNALKVSIANDHALFDASTLNESDYINLKIGSDAHARTNEDYLVLAMKLEDGATLDGFRIVDQSAKPHYANDWVAGFGVKSIDTPYISDDSYSLYVIDLEETGMNVTNTLDLYYSGTGKLLIDEAFFANDFTSIELGSERDIKKEDGSDMVLDLGGYTYVYGMKTAADGFALKLAGNGSATLETLRFEYNGFTYWIKDGDIKDQYGHALDKDHIVAEAGETIFVDFEKSGFTIPEAGADLHMHIGDFNDTIEAGVQTLTLVSISELNHKVQTTALAPLTCTDLSGYQYVGSLGSTRKANDNVRLKVTVSGGALDSLRIADGTAEYWVNTQDNPARKQLYLLGGEVLEAGRTYAEDTTLIFDLSLSGVQFNGATHAHIGGIGTGNLTFSSIELLTDSLSYSDIYNLFYAPAI